MIRTLTHAGPRRWALTCGILVAALLALLVALGLSVELPTRSGGEQALQPKSGEFHGTEDQVEPGVSRESRSGEEAAGSERTSVTGEADASLDASVRGAASDAGQSLAVPEIGLRVIRTGALTVEVPAGELRSETAAVSRIARSVGGEVAGSSVISDDEAGRHTGTITVRVPSERFDIAMERLAEIGTVRNQEVTSTDVTQEYVDVRSRLRHAQAVEARLLKFLQRTTDVAGALAIQDRLDQVQREIELAKGRLQYLEQQTSYATITVSLTEKGSADKPRDGWGLGAALDTAAHRFVDTVAAGIVAMGAALPVLLLLAVVAYAARRTIVRRRADGRKAQGAAEAFPGD